MGSLLWRAGNAGETHISLVGRGAGPHVVLFSCGMALGSVFGEMLSTVAPGKLALSWLGATLAA